MVTVTPNLSSANFAFALGGVTSADASKAVDLTIEFVDSATGDPVDFTGSFLVDDIDNDGSKFEGGGVILNADVNNVVSVATNDPTNIQTSIAPGNNVVVTSVLTPNESGDPTNARIDVNAVDTLVLTVVGDFDGDSGHALAFSDQESVDGNVTIINGFDSDSDGISNHVDLDSDNDGISDLVESGANASLVDTDGNGILDGDTDVDSDGLLEVAGLTDSDTTSGNNSDGQTPNDTDSDGVEDYLETDSDSDGIADSLEGQVTSDPIVASGLDSDSDGIDDAFDGTDGFGSNGTTLATFSDSVDTDSDGVTDFTATDSDSDGIADSLETTNDSDLDGEFDFRDTDSDSDGIADSLEGLEDADSDGTLDFLDTDSDSDGIADSLETTLDSDSDGVFDFRETDSDQDGLADSLETTNDEDSDGTFDFRQPIDTDGDGIADFLDIDDDNDGVLDADESNAFNALDGVFNNSFDISSEETAPEGIEFSADGTRLFVTGGSGNVTQYTLDNPFDLSNASSVTLDGVFSVAAEVGNAVDVTFSSDGLTLFVTDLNNDDITQYSLTSAFDVVTSTIMFETTFSVGGEQGLVEGITFSNDGTQLFVTGRSGDDIDVYELDTAFDLSDTVTSAGTVSITTESQQPQSIEFSPDGLQVYVVDGDDDEINVYTLTSPFDTSTISFSGTLSISGQDTSPTDLVFSADGTSFFVLGNQGNAIDQYSVTNLEIDSDSDGIIDQLDLDSDNDGISDLFEAGLGVTIDADGNGVVDGLVDADSDGLIDSVDTDTSLQTALSTVSDTDTDDLEGTDADSDGIDDAFDGTDGFGSDGATLESFSNPEDTDSDGIADFLESDSDSDGLADSLESINDSDSDGEFDFRDIDSDSDGIADSLESKTS